MKATKTAMSNITDRTVGIRILLPLIPLFSAVLLAAVGILYPYQLNAAAEQLHHTTPLANPALTVHTDTAIAPAVVSALSEITAPIPAVTYDTHAQDGTSIRLTALDPEFLAQAVVLHQGRMPQNAQECIAVVLSPDADITLGVTVRPGGEDGVVLYNPNTDEPCALTVVGIGENLLSALAPVSDNPVEWLLYTSDSSAWQNDAVTHCLSLTEGTADAVQAILHQTQQAQDAYLTALTEEKRIALYQAAEKADDDVLSQEIALQALDNRLDTANIRASELENNMMDAIAALQTEQQQFVSDMEYNEYYALRQVDLVPRRDRAEEGYAKKEAEIALIYDNLCLAYDECDAVRAEIAAAQQEYAKIQHAADQAHAALDALDAAATTGTRFSVTASDTQSGLSRLQSSAASTRKTALLYGAAALVIYLIVTVAVCRTHMMLTSVLAALTACSAAVLGGCLLPQLLFRQTFPALIGILSVGGFSAQVLFFAVPTALIAALLTVSLILLRRRIMR